MHIAQVRFFHERKVLGGLSRGTELLLPSLQLHHSGRYHCQATVGRVLPGWQESALQMVAVQGEHPLPNTHLAGCSPPSPAGSASPLPPGSLPELFTVPVLRLEGPAEPREGTPVALGCLSHLSPLRPLTRLQHLFYQDDMVVGGPQGSPQLQLPAVGLSHSGNYSCEVRTETASVRKRSTPVTVTVRSECAGGIGAYQGPAAIPGSPHPFPGPSLGSLHASLGPPFLPRFLPRSPHPPRVLPFISRSPHPCLGPPHFSLGSPHPSPGPSIPPWGCPILPCCPSMLPRSLHPSSGPPSLSGSLHLTLGSPPSLSLGPPSLPVSSLQGSQSRGCRWWHSPLGGRWQREITWC